MTKLNKKNILISILIIAIIATFMSVAIMENNSKNNKYESISSIDISPTSTINVDGRNGKVATGYVSPYANSGGYAIYNAATFNTFLTAAASATDTNQVYGYLTSSFTYDEAVKGTIFKYAHLDGCGYEITLSHNDSVDNSSTSDPFDKYEVWKSEATLPHYSGSNCFTPFGDVQGGSFYTSGYLGGLAMHSEIKNLKIKRTGYWNYWYFKEYNAIKNSKGALYRPYAVGILFGYMWDCNIDNCSLDMQNYFYFFMQTAQDGGDYNSVSNLCMGGYAGVFDGKDTTSAISNSSINLNKAYNSDSKERPIMEGHSAGVKNGAFQRNSARAFVGGMTGVLCNNAKMYNLTVTGDGSLYAEGHGPTYNSGNDRACFAGAICGSNFTDRNLHLYNTHTDLEAASCGLIDGVISTWIGFTTRDVGSFRASDLSISTQGLVYQTGTMCGYSSLGQVKNIYFNMTSEELAAAVTANVNTYKNAYNSSGSVEFITTAPSTNNANYIKLKPDDTLGNSSDTMNLFFADLTINAGLDVGYDVTKYQNYAENTGMFVWNMTYYTKNENGTFEARFNPKFYNLTTSVAGAMSNYKQVKLSDQGGVIPRNNSALECRVEATYGHAVKYQLDDLNHYEVSLGSKTYNNINGITTPTINLYAFNGMSYVQFRPLVANNSNINKTANVTYYTNPSIWAVYETGSNVVRNLDYILNSTNYEILVYNNINNTSSVDYKYDFLDETNKIVAYKADNTYFNDTNTRWQPKYKYTINPITVNTGYWSTVNNNIDNIAYSVPQDVVYYGQSTPFEYKIPDNTFLKEADRVNVSMKYYQLNYTPISRENVQNNVDYYAFVDGDYVFKGKPTSASFGDYDTYYIQTAVSVDQMKNVGYYKVVIEDINSANYTLQSMTKEYYFKINPRQLYVNYSNLYNITYTGESRQATYAISNQTRNETLVASQPGLAYFDANIQIWNVLDSTAVVVTYTTGNNYINVGHYTIEISLASGLMERNYLLPSNASHLSTDYDNSYIDILEADLESGVEYFKKDGANYISLGTIDDDFEWGLGNYYYDNGLYHTSFITNNNKVSKIIRSVEIQNVTLKLGVEYNGGAYVSNMNHRQYEEIDVIKANNLQYFNENYSEAKIYFENEERNVYKVEETYAGYNSLVLALIGVPIGNGVYDHVYTNISYYPAVYDSENSRYKIKDGETPVTICEAVDIYIAAISFRTQTYRNYNKEVFYMLYEVKPMEAEVGINGTDLPTSIEYSSQDNSSIYLDLIGKKDDGAKIYVDGISRVDQGRGMGIVYKYYIQDDEYDEDDKIEINSKIYAPVQNIVNVGSYIIIVSNSLNENYTPVYNITNCPLVYNTEPYFTLEVTPQVIHVVVEKTTKTYTETFDGEVPFEVVSGELLEEEASIVIVSLGFEANAAVGNYDIIAHIDGDIYGNYTVVVDNGTNMFVVDQIVLTYDLGELTKIYSDLFDDESIEATLISGTILDEDELELSYSSEGFEGAAEVDEYTITISLSGENASNYRAVTNTKLQVLQKELTIDEISIVVDLEYDGTAKHVVVTFIGVKEGDVVNGVALYNNEEEAIKVGHYDVLVVDVDNNNYSLEAQTESEFDFDITKREVTIEVGEFTMGYADISLSPDGLGYTISEGSKEFVVGDEISMIFTTIDEDTMLEDCGTYENVVIATLTGDALNNYDLISIPGNLTISPKNIETMTLQNPSATYTGENLINAIELATSSTSGYTIVVKQDGEEVTSVVNAGTYIIEVTGDDELFIGKVELEFTVNKAQITEDMVSNSNFVIHYNKVVYTNNITQEMSIGKAENALVSGNELGELKAMTRYTVYVQFAESNNYLASEIFELTVTTSYDPNAINSTLDTLNANFNFNSIDIYLEVIENIDKVSSADASVVNTEKLEAVTQKYNNLINGAKDVIVGAQGVVAKATSTNLRVASVSACLSGIVVVGLCAGLIRKKKEKETK